MRLGSRRRSTLPEVPMSAEATRPTRCPRPRARGPSAGIDLRRIDLRRLGRAALLGPPPADRLPGRHRPCRRGPPRPPPRRRPRRAAPGLRPRRVLAPRPDAQERRAVHHPSARRHPDPRRTGRRDHHLDGLPAPRHRRGHRGDPRSGAARSSARRSATSSTASPSWRRSTTAPPPSPRPSARCSSPPATMSA